MSHLSTRTSPSPARPALHPAGTARTGPSLPTGAVVAPLPTPVAPPLLAAVPTADASSEDGSLVAEYGLLAVVAATVAGVLISWATSGALATFFGQLLQHARSLVVS